MKKIKEAQKFLVEENVDGWLLYDWQGINPLALNFLDAKAHTRRFFYWIPKNGEPIKLVHQIEQDALDHLPGKKVIYLSYNKLEEELKNLLHHSKVILMETSEKNRLPYVSKVDGGTLDLIRSFDVNVKTSAYLIQHFTTLSQKQFELHTEVMHVLEMALEKSCDLISSGLVNEYEVQSLIMELFEQNQLVTHFPPIVAINANGANPHYFPKKEKSDPIKPGDFILIDLWAKKDVNGGVYADITKVFKYQAKPTEFEVEIFNIVKGAQTKAIELIKSRLEKNQPVMGFEVDRIARDYIEHKGYGDAFFHRLGHNIDENDHGSGAHLDSLETFDDRPLLPNTLFSIEPGIYLPGKIGIRLECNVWIDSKNKMHITGGMQDNIIEF